MDRDKKIDLISSELLNDTGREEQSLLENWKDEKADNRKLHELLKCIKLSSDVTEYAESVRDDILIQLNTKINKASHRLRWTRNIAASITILMIIGATGYFSYYKGYKNQNTQLVTVNTPPRTKSSIMLPDGSSVTLNAGSTLIYPASFVGKERKVSIVGEGFFDITHQANFPFVISTEDIFIQVLGTKFNVKAYDETSTVTLLEGKVQVNVDEMEEIVFLNPNEKIVYTKGENSLTVSTVNAENEISWMNGILVFEDQPLNDVLKTLGRHYNATFETQNFNPNEINLTMKIVDEPLEQALDYIRHATEINYEIKKNIHTNDTSPNYQVILTQ